LYATTPGLDGARRAESLALATQAVGLQPECGDFWDSLAAARAARGDFAQAVANARRAEELAVGEPDRGEYRRRRKAYEHGRAPW